MYGLAQFWQSTIGKKIVMAVTGIIGILFVIGHMSGNFLMFKGQGAMHDYALLLRTSMPLLWAVRAALIAAVVLHALSAYQLTMRARAARPADYAVRKPQVTTLAAKTMRWGGVYLLVFIVYHILHMTLGTVHPQFTHLDPYNNLRIGLANPAVAAAYLVGMLFLGLHLYHGTWAVFRTLGVARPSAQPLKRRLAVVVAIAVAAGFAVIPVAALAGLFPEAPAMAEEAH
ncbi:MAG: succinate dehydrogenase cytochrome b subunit [Gemmatimonadetes bacterium]|nr:succinate dehydrogenase cytochrome b subunit [Gemmatimonadota bacterium]